MDFLKAEIARKKKIIAESSVMTNDKKYFKRGDLAAKQEEDYWRKHKRLKSDHEESNLSLQDGSEAGTSEIKTQKTLPRQEVIKRLRERNEPILLFGETEEESLQRLKKVEMMAPEINKGFKNDLKTAMEDVDEQYLQELLKSGDSKETETKNDVTVLDDGVNIEDILKKAENWEKGQDEGLDSEIVLNKFKLILKLWGNELNERPNEVKRGFQGKLASAQHSQTVTYMKPLLRKLKKKQLSSDILSCMADIVGYMLERNYLKANDAYLEMAIGNAAWPIGVTMVGIHARTGREKIFARNVAHVLNDETQRKYIQGVKRLMTCCQRFFPTDPSRCVNFEGTIH